MIETTVDVKRSIAIHKCSGNLTNKDMSDAINAFYVGSTNKYTLWDFSNASMNNIPIESVKQLIILEQKRASSIVGGRTAVVAPKDLEYGYARMLQIQSDTNDLLFKVGVFKTLEEANQWLLQEE
jgi:hypothetical protein